MDETLNVHKLVHDGETLWLILVMKDLTNEKLELWAWFGTNYSPKIGCNKDHFGICTGEGDCDPQPSPNKISSYRHPGTVQACSVRRETLIYRKETCELNGLQPSMAASMCFVNVI